MNTVPPNDFGHYEMLDALVQLEPAEALDTELAGQFAAIGIVKDEKFAPDARLRKILDEAVAVGNAASRMLGMGASPTEGFRYYDGDSAWWNMLFVGGFEFTNPPPEITPDGVKPYPNQGARRLHSRTSMFYTATAITPAMCMRLTGVGSQYLVANVDAAGEPFDGAKTYRVSLPKDIPAARFWSLNLYDNQTRSLLQTDAALSPGRQPGVPLTRRGGRSRRLHRRLLLAHPARRRRPRQLDPDRPREGLVRHPALLQPAAALLRQVLAGRRVRARELTTRWGPARSRISDRIVEATMGEAFFWGAVGASALLVGAVVAYVASPSERFIADRHGARRRPPHRLGGVRAHRRSTEDRRGRAGRLLHADRCGDVHPRQLVPRSRGAGDRKDSSGAQEDGSPLAIVFGSVLDGIPESFVLGLTVLEGGVSVGLLMGVLLSNLPEGMSSSAGLRIAGWTRKRVFGMWFAIMVVSGVSAALGYQLLGDSSGRSGAFAQGFAAGALLAMVADTMLPEAYEVEKGFTGSLVAVGFAISLILSSL